jgi:hypothetical protein
LRAKILIYLLYTASFEIHSSNIFIEETTFLYHIMAVRYDNKKCLRMNLRIRGGKVEKKDEITINS